MVADEIRSHRARRRKHRRRRIVVTAAGIAVVAGGSAAAVAATTGHNSSLRLATVSRASVAQTVESSGTVASSQKAAATFSVVGTVESVAVKVGSTVNKGEVLAQLDTTSLRGAVYTDQATLATAKQKLEADETGETSSSTGNFGNSTATPSSYETQAGAGNPTATLTVEFVQADAPTHSSATNLPDLIKQIAAAQPAVVDAQKNIDTTQSAIDAAQKTVDADIVQNTKFRDAQQTACAGIGSADSSGPSSSASPTAAPTATPTSTPTATPTSGPTPVPAACMTAMANYQAFADTLSTDMGTLSGLITTQDRYIQNLKTASKTLDTLLGKLPAAAGSNSSGQSRSSGSAKSNSNSSANNSHSNTPNSSRSNGPSQSGKSNSGNISRSSTSGESHSSGSSRTGTGNGSGAQNETGSAQTTTSQPASAAQLAADQGSIDAAQASLVVDQQKLTAATLTSPISGKVAAVGIAAGTAPAGQSITIVGTGIQQADIAVPLGEIDLVKVGQNATITADGITKKLHGTVRSVGLLSSTTGSTTTFPVTVELDASSPALFDGAGADVVIGTATATNVIVVPNSAIHTTANGRHTVTVVNGNKMTTVRVTVGVVGNSLSQITSGLKLGQRVVLADLAQKLPSSSTSSNTGTFRGFGGRAFNVGSRAGR